MIEHPVDAVFSAMADIEQRPRWVAPAQERSKITEGPIGKDIAKLEELIAADSA